MDIPTSHPSYPYPTIIEALCELHFRLPEESPWRPSLLGELFRTIQVDFPEMEPATEMGVQLQLSQRGVRQTFLPPRQRMQYKHASRPLLLQLAENIFTVNLLVPYPGWETMRRDILTFWHRAVEVLQASAITRIGLRYINRVDRESPHDRPGSWLKANDYIGPGILRSMPGFLSRAEVHLDVPDRIIVTLGDQPPSSNSPHGAIVLDIDRIVEQEIPPDENAISPELERLHNDIWMVFASAKTEKFDQLLQRGRS